MNSLCNVAFEIIRFDSHHNVFETKSKSRPKTVYMKHAVQCIFRDLVDCGLILLFG